ncbi:uncharacterized protein LOC122662154 [Telopea speciosissima]|uniref:uncharacterized protein LOC122662154 n=1 Tax=Telopea speciosissima TaxID=54955 RepID=UPI001CC64BE3|nr:uncharacterized protein LOC122662154 [Telopea speciosissima]
MCKKNTSNISLLCCEETKDLSKPCRFFFSLLKEALSHFHNLPGRVSSARPEEEYLSSDIDDDLEVIILEIQSGAMEAKLRRVSNSDSQRWVLLQGMEEFLFTSSKEVVKEVEDNKHEDKEVESFYSVGSCFSRCSSASRDVFFSVGSRLSRCSSMNGIDFGDDKRRSIIQELCHCEGWPFGLGRKALLLPPLPRCPSESWLWRKGNRIYS